jgi:hypothetical protein
MHYDLNQVDRHHHVNLSESAPPVLIPKRCACGKTAFAKQLDQHGKCVGCQFDERAATLQPEDLEVLCHMLGATHHRPRVRWCLRNEYLANRRDLPSMTRLIAAGFVRAGGALLQLQYFHATEAGIKLAVQTGKRAAALGARP